MQKNCCATFCLRGDSIEKLEKTLRERQGTVRALHLLTGGNPRLVKTFYRLLAEGLRGDIRSELERLMDEFTPYFKAIVDALPVQQQRIFDAVALAWDPVEVASLATATRLPSNQVSAQLRSLVKAGLLREAAGGPKRKTYLLADRFSNIHYLMRHGRAARNRLDWFVALVRIVFPDRAAADVLAKAAREAAECGPEGRLDARSVLHSALSRAESGEDRRALMHATLREGWNSKAWESLDQWFDAARAQADLPEVGIIGFCRTMPEQLRKKLGFKPDQARWWYHLGDFLKEKEVWTVAEAAYRKAIELDPKCADPWNRLGTVLRGQLGRRGEAEAAYRKAIELDPKSAYPWFGLGTVLAVHLGRPGEAEAAYRKAIELDPKLAYPWNNLGKVLAAHLGRPSEAEAAYRKAIELDPKLANPWSGLAEVLSRSEGRREEARACALNGLSLKPDSAFARHMFRKVCSDHAGDWRALLPALVAWCLSHPKADEVFHFTVDGLLRLARLTKPAEALALLDSLPDAAPFQTVRDTFVAHDHRDHLQTLAPERQTIVLALLDRLAAPPEATAPKTKPKSAKSGRKS